MEIDRRDQMERVHPREHGWTGEVEVFGYFKRKAPSHLVGALASFSPGARTPWKTNPLGQTIVIVSGTGWVQSQGEEIVAVHAGDIVAWKPGETHWEGATPDSSMTYFAVQEEDDLSISFGEAISDDEYREGPR